MQDGEMRIGAGHPHPRSREGRPGARHPRITRRWLESAASAHRAAFEEEMARSRRALDREFDRFWRARRSA